MKCYRNPEKRKTSSAYREFWEFFHGEGDK